MVSIVRRLVIGLILLSGFLFSPTFSDGKPFDEGIRIDVPVGGNVHVENKFGNVQAEVWDKTYVAVAASFESSAPTAQRRSPILIDNRGKDLSISVFRAPNDPPTTVHLMVRIPALSKLDIVTVNGRIKLIGPAATAMLRSQSGDIESIVVGGTDTAISARAPKGSIRSSIPGAQPTDPHYLQARLGNGARQIDVETQSGQIFIAVAEETPTRRPERQPELIGANAARSSAGTPAAASQGQEIEEGDVIRVDSQLVTINMSVVDSSTRRGLLGLAQSDFRLFEDGEEQQIIQFESASAPFDLVLLIDVSGSTREKVTLMRSAALRFVNTARPADRIGIITFAGAPTVISTLTADRELLRQRVATIDTSRGDTKLYDAALFATNEFLKDSKRMRRTAVVLMSDGLDGTIPGVSDQVGSQTSYREILDHLQEFDGVFYTLWLNTRYLALNPRDTQPEAFDEAYDRMREMSEAGGGIFYEVQRLEDLAGAYEKVVADLGTVYSLAYRPANNTRDGKWRAIRVRVNRNNAVARGKRGYYAN